MKENGTNKVQKQSVWEEQRNKNLQIYIWQQYVVYKQQMFWKFTHAKH